MCRQFDSSQHHGVHAVVRGQHHILIIISSETLFAVNVSRVIFLGLCPYM